MFLRFLNSSAIRLTRSLFFLFTLLATGANAQRQLWQTLSPATAVAPAAAQANRNALYVPPMGINFTGNGVCTASRVIENPTDTILSFSFAGLPLTAQALTDSFVLSLPNPADTTASRRKLALQIIPAWLKSNRWGNSSLVWSGIFTDSVQYKRQMDPIGMLFSAYSLQCGHFAEAYKVLMLATGYFKVADFRTVSLTGHSLIEVNIEGGWVLVDNDATTPFLYAPNAANPNGLATAEDIYFDTSLTSKNLYTPAGGFTSVLSYDDYMELWTAGPKPTTWPGNHYDVNENLSGTFTLPPHARITAALPTTYYLDSADAGTQQVLPVLNYYIGIINNINCDDACYDNYIDSITLALHPLLPQVSVAGLRNAMQQSLLVFYNSQTQQGAYLRNYYNRFEVPAWQLEFTTTDTMPFRNRLSLPFLVLQANQPGVVGDTTLSGPAVFKLWDGAQTPVCTPAAVNYLQMGEAYAGLNRFELAVNEYVIPRVQEWYLQTDDVNRPTVTNYINFDKEATGINTPFAMAAMQLYPNPATNMLNITGNNSAIQQYTITNLLGEVVLQGNTEATQHAQINTSQLAAGLYVIHVQCSTEEFTGRFTKE